MHPLPRRTPLALAVQRPTLHKNLLTSVLLTATLLGSSMANAAPVKVNIAVQPLSSALTELGLQTNLQILYSPDQVAGIKSRAVSGSLEPSEALAAMLKDSGISFQINGSSVTLVSGAADSTLQLGATTISGQALGLTTEDSGSYTTGATTTATKLPLTIRETPQSVTVVTRQQMDDRGEKNIGDVLRNTPGISVQQYDSDRTEYSTRGFAITNFQYDGVNNVYDGVYDEGATHVDMATYDRVEIIKGATGLMTGSGDPSATVNLVRKKPTKEFKASITGTAGSWDNYRTEGDISGPLNDSGSVRGRFVGAYQDKNSYIDHYTQKKDVYYGILEADLSEDTLLTFGIDKQSVTPRGSSWTGNPVYFSDGGRTDFPRSFNPGADWSRRDFDSVTYFTSLEQALANDWKLKVSLNEKISDHDTQLASASGGNPDRATGEGMFLYWGRWEGHRVQDSADINLSGPFTLGGREHELVAGFMASHSRQTGATFDTSAFSQVPGSIYDWNSHLPKQDFPKNGKYERTQSQNGIYLATRLRPTDDLSVILGSRLSTFKYNEDYSYNAGTGMSDTHASYKEHGVVTPYAGVVYDLNDTYSLYGSYTNIYQPQIYKDADGKTLAPVEGNAYETGLKAAYLDGRLNASLAFFRIEQDNFAESIGTNPVTNEGIYKAIDGATTNGVELELAGELQEGWNLSAGYTYARTRDQDEQRIYGYPLSTTKPEHVFRTFTTYRLPGVLNKVTVGGGVSWQSAFYGKIYSAPAGDYTRIKQGGYSLVDLMTKYEYDEHLSFTVNANNVFDKKYLTGLGNFDTTFYGEPRNLQLTAKYNF
ncbi:outer-membrane receptor for ferric coprogen and ferric-rhodotorulic acid [Pseudomonas koreensis]|uniref:TonB-dependent siderophore receptor n=1 Tax=Pseudomonas TaxID=286 RepID=UPI00087B7BFD|nr:MULTISPECIES: TonB-dependent siderophore receptor [Pseudomonas]KAB0514567.1 TonB-dependent siderophore receptor [Pseudomonas koreensis]NNA62209.1 TonB-dependent siderophore receptor [Pseudomonas koreensis]SDC76338.1 outer-membrane receptor for ferric coprogen and ferric-rhodotorulic acid [Pseudomonas koreensis]